MKDTFKTRRLKLLMMSIVAVLVCIAAIVLSEFSVLAQHAILRSICLVAFVLSACVLIVALFVRLRQSLLTECEKYQRCANIIRNLEEAVIIVERESLTIKEANPALQRRLGYTETELAGRNIGEIFRNLPLDGVRDPWRNQQLIHECQLQTRGGQLVEVEITISTVSDRQGELVCLLGRDITSRKRAERHAIDHRRRLSRLANHDALTGLPNRLFLRARLPRLLRRLADTKRVLAVFYVDVDHFKDINDSYGHPFGDKLLRIFSQRLKAVVGAQDVVVRMGGDEFVVVASLLAGESAAEAIAMRLVAMVQAPIFIDDVTTTMSASIGVALYPCHAVDTETLLKHADIALYQAKQAGRNGYKLFTADMNVEVSEQVALEQALRHALGSNELYVEYQPIMELQSGRLVAVEALVRWLHPERGLVPPARFIPVAEKSGLILVVGEFVLHTVMRQLQQWRQAGVPLAPVAINISSVQLQGVKFSALIEQLTVQFDIESKWLQFEISELAGSYNSEEVLAALQALRDLGARVVIDDFGAGVATPEYLKSLPVDGVKIDKNIVADVTRDIHDVAIVSNIVNMAHELHLYTVAEGVETVEQADRLRELGCDQAQGYYYTRPIAAEGCEKLLRQMDSAQPTDSAWIRPLRRN